MSKTLLLVISVFIHAGLFIYPNKGNKDLSIPNQKGSTESFTHKTTQVVIIHQEKTVYKETQRNKKKKELTRRTDIIQDSTKLKNRDNLFRFKGTFPSPAYPKLSKLRGEQGGLVVKIIVKGGKVVDVNLIESSGFGRLDSNALSVIKKWIFEDPKDISFKRKITYKLGKK